MFAPAPAWRAALRIGRRDALRHKGRHALVAILVAAPVFAVAVVDVIARSNALDPADRVAVELGAVAQGSVQGFGVPIVQTPNGDEVTTTTDAGPVPADSTTLTTAEVGRRLSAVLPAGDELLPRVAWSAAPRLRIGDRSVSASWEEFDLAAPGVRGIFTTVAGRPPGQAGEVAVSVALADSAGLRAGSTVDVPAAAVAAGAAGGRRTLTVTGIVREANLPKQSLLVGPPGTMLPATARTLTAAEHTWYVAGPGPLGWPEVERLNQLGARVISRSLLLDPPPADRLPPEATAAQDEFDGQGAVILLVVVGLILLQIVLLAGPALAVGARRNQQMLALVAATGGERRHVRRIVLTTGLVVGLAGSVVAAALGALAGAVVVVVFRSRGDLVAPRIDVGWLDLVGLALLGGLTALTAALLPARQAARLDVLAALTGRRVSERVRRRTPVLGAGVAAAGIALTLWGAAGHHAVAVVLGIALGELGLVATTGAAVAVVSRLSGRLPLSLRIAVRDARRHRGRTAPAVAAVMAAMAGGLAAVLYVGSLDRHDGRQYSASTAPGVVTVSVPPQVTAADRTAIEQALRATLPVSSVVVQRVPRDVWVDAVRAPGQDCPGWRQAGEPSAAERAALDRDPRCAPLSMLGGTLIDDGTTASIVLGRLSPAERQALAAGRVLVGDPLAVAPDGTARLQLTPDGGQGPSQERVVPAAALAGPERVSLVIPPPVARSMGIGTSEQALLAATERMPTAAEEERAAAALEDLPVSWQPYLGVERGYQSDYGPGLLALVVAALAVALVGSLTSVGLAAAEGRADAATLMAVGSAPGMRRRIAAAQAAVVVGLGAVLGTLGGFLSGYALVRLQMPAADVAGWFPRNASDEWTFDVRWPYVAAIVVGIPLVTVVLAFVTARTRLTLTRRLTG